MNRTAQRWPRLPGLFGAGLGFAGGTAATVFSALGALVDPVSAPVLVVAVVSAVTTLPGALLAGLQSWLLYASFILGDTGHLALTSPSLSAAGVLTGTAVVATGAGAAIRWIQRPVSVVRRAGQDVLLLSR